MHDLERTNNQPRCRALVGTLILACVASCNSSLSVRVERLDFPPTAKAVGAQAAYDEAINNWKSSHEAGTTLSRKLAAVATAGETADSLSTNLKEFALSAAGSGLIPDDWGGDFGKLETASQELARFSMSCTSALEKAVTDRSKFLILYDQIMANGVVLESEMQFIFAPEEKMRFVAMEEFLGTTSEAFKPLLASDITKPLRSLGNVGAAISLGSTGSSDGFGGFSMPDVFVIQPSSKLYKYVLEAEPLGNPLSDVQVSTTGDAVVIIVQESAGQFRVKRVSNDPTKLIQNATFVADMALRAAAKYGAL